MCVVILILNTIAFNFPRQFFHVTSKENENKRKKELEGFKLDRMCLILLYYQFHPEEKSVGQF